MASHLITKLPKRLIIFQQKATLFFSTRSPPSLTSFRTVKSAIIFESDPEKLAHIFTSSAPFATFRRHRSLYHFSIRKLAHLNRPDLADQVLASLLRKTTPHQLNSEHFWTRILSLYAEAGLVDNALNLFDKMLQQKVCPFTERTLYAMLNVLVVNEIYDERFDKALELVPKKLGVKVGVRSYNLALKACCGAKDVEKARAIMERMENVDGVVPNIDSYNVLLGGYLAKGGKGFKGFDEVVRVILDKGLEGNLSTYNCRIFRLCRSKEGIRARKLLDEMIVKGVKPNAKTYEAVVSCFCEVGDLESAKKVLEGARDGFASPRVYFCLMGKMVEEGEFGLALESCKEILGRKWIPPFGLMEGLVKGLVKISKMEDAKEVVEEMKLRLRGAAVDSWGKVEASLPICKSSASLEE